MKGRKKNVVSCETFDDSTQVGSTNARCADFGGIHGPSTKDPTETLVSIASIHAVDRRWCVVRAGNVGSIVLLTLSEARWHCNDKVSLGMETRYFFRVRTEGREEQNEAWMTSRRDWQFAILIERNERSISRIASRLFPHGNKMNSKGIF